MKNYFSCLTIVTVFSLLTACGGGGDGFTSEGLNSPTNLSTTVDGLNIELTWNDNSANETGFIVERSTTSDSGFAVIKTTEQNQESYIDSSLTPETTYYYRIKAFNQSLESGYSNTASETTGNVLSLSPVTSFVREGASSVATIPDPLTVTLLPAPVSDTFITVTSSDPSSLTIVDDGVTIPAGISTAPVIVSGVMQSPSVSVTATLGVNSESANIRVIGAAEVPQLSSISSSTNTVALDVELMITVTLDIPARIGGEGISLFTDLGAVPSFVTVTENTLTASFVFSAGSSAGDATISARDGTGNMYSIIVTVN